MTLTVSETAMNEPTHPPVRLPQGLLLLDGALVPALQPGRTIDAVDPATGRTIMAIPPAAKPMSSAPWPPRIAVSKATLGAGYARSIAAGCSNGWRCWWRRIARNWRCWSRSTAASSSA